MPLAAINQMQNIILDFSQKETQKRNRNNLRLDIERLNIYEPLREDVLSEINLLEIEKADQYISKFDYDVPTQSIKAILQNIYSNKSIELINLVEGMTDTKILKINGTAKYILKKVSLPEDTLYRHWERIKCCLLSLVEGETIKDQVYDLFVNHPGQIFNRQFSHLNNAQREKLAYVFGKKLNVPKVVVIRAEDGVFSLHNFIENQGSSRTFDIAAPKNQALINMQSLQNIGILDILLENQDRNPGNILVIDETKLSSCFYGSSCQLILIPVDHALSYQQNNFQQSSSVFLGEINSPCWLEWKRADEMLTDQTKKNIDDFNAFAMMQEAIDAGLIVDQKVQRSLFQNIDFLKKFIQHNPNTTLKELYKAFLSMKTGDAANREVRS